MQEPLASGARPTRRLHPLGGRRWLLHVATSHWPASSAGQHCHACSTCPSQPHLARHDAASVLRSVASVRFRAQGMCPASEGWVADLPRRAGTKRAGNTCRGPFWAISKTSQRSSGNPDRPDVGLLAGYDSGEFRAIYDLEDCLMEGQRARRMSEGDETPTESASADATRAQVEAESNTSPRTRTDDAAPRSDAPGTRATPASGPSRRRRGTPASTRGNDNAGDGTRSRTDSSRHRPDRTQSAAAPSGASSGAPAEPRSSRSSRRRRSDTPSSGSGPSPAPGQSGRRRAAPTADAASSDAPVPSLPSPADHTELRAGTPPPALPSPPHPPAVPPPPMTPAPAASTPPVAIPMPPPQPAASTTSGSGAAATRPTDPFAWDADRPVTPSSADRVASAAGRLFESLGGATPEQARPLANRLVRTVRSSPKGVVAAVLVGLFVLWRILR